MLDTLMQRAKQTGVAGRITPLLCDENNIGNHDEVDFALAFWMAHETPDERLFFTQVQTILKKTGTLLLAEPKLHVTGDNFQKMLNIAQETGLRRIGSPLISLSHAALFEKQ